MAKLQNVVVRHDAEIHVVTKCGLSSHRNPCNDTTVEAYLLDSHLAIQAFMHGKVSGMDSGIRVTSSYKLVNPERDILENGQLCPCPHTSMHV